MTGRLAHELKSKPIASRTLEAYLNLIRTTDRLRRVAEELIRPYDLSETSYNVLRILRGAQPDGLPCGAIGERLLTMDPDITRLVDRLERRSLVERVRSLSDRRVVLVRIAPPGLVLLDELDIDRRAVAALEPYLGQLTPERLDTLIDLLETIRHPNPNPGTPP